MFWPLYLSDLIIGSPPRPRQSQPYLTPFSPITSLLISSISGTLLSWAYALFVLCLEQSSSTNHMVNSFTSFSSFLKYVLLNEDSLNHPVLNCSLPLSFLQHQSCPVFFSPIAFITFQHTMFLSCFGLFLSSVPHQEINSLRTVIFILAYKNALSK